LKIKRKHPKLKDVGCSWERHIRSSKIRPISKTNPLRTIKQHVNVRTKQVDQIIETILEFPFLWISNLGLGRESKVEEIIKMGTHASLRLTNAPSPQLMFPYA